MIPIPNMEYTQRYRHYLLPQDTHYEIGELYLKKSLEKAEKYDYQFAVRIWDLALTLRALIDSLKQRSHGCVIFNTAEDLILPWLDDAEIKSLLEVPEIVKGLKWLSVPYQFDHGVAPSRFDHANGLPAHHKHTKSI